MNSQPIVLFDMNAIKHRQNEPINLKYLSAQRVLYARAKKTFGGQVLVTVFISVTLNFLKFVPATLLKFDINPFVGFLSLLICFADILFFNVYISGLRTNAAKVQELFDCNLFDLSWNGTNSGTKPENDIIEENAEKLVPDPNMPLENWYDINLEGLSKERSILLCQETNLFYDGKLREHFKTANVLCCVAVFVISLGIAIITDIKVRSYLTTVLLPVLPVITITLKTIMENRKSLAASSELKKAVLQLKSRQEEPTMQELRQVQDKIYCGRKDSALVPEWYYQWKRSKLEKAMKANADH
jgi:hypothetical protein